MQPEGKYNEKTQRGVEYKGCIDLLHSTEVMRSGSTVGIKNADREWKLVAASTAVAGHWVKQLRQVV